MNEPRAEIDHERFVVPFETDEEFVGLPWSQFELFVDVDHGATVVGSSLGQNTHSLGFDCAHEMKDTVIAE